ncbi:MAG: hypothetical protein ACLP01_03180 [Solirubrobacteraceae bacterium]
MIHRLSRRKLVAAAAVAVGLASLGSWAGLASAAGPPSPSTLRAIGSSPQAAATQPRVGLGATPITQPLIVVSFAGGRATVLGGSAVSGSGSASDAAHAASIPISAALCSVDFTTAKFTQVVHKSVRVRWFGGIGCSRRLELFGEAFLAESATVFDGHGNYYKTVASSAVSGNANTVVPRPNPSLYIWYATNVYFQERPSRGVIAVVPSANQQLNAATSCKVVKSSSYGFGVHCDIYSQRF